MFISKEMLKKHSKIANLRIKFMFMVKLGFKATLIIFLKRFFLIDHYYVLQRGLSLPIAIPPIRSQVTLSQANDDDMSNALDEIDNLDANSKHELISRLLFYRTGIHSCYAAKIKSNKIAYLQWLIYPTENEIIRNHFKGLFYPLKDTQVLIENVFTFPTYRGIGLMAHMTARLLEIARNSGYKSAIMYIRKDRIESLSQNLMLGFKITSLLRVLKIFGITITKPVNI